MKNWLLIVLFLIYVTSISLAATNVSLKITVDAKGAGLIIGNTDQGSTVINCTVGSTGCSNFVPIASGTIVILNPSAIGGASFAGFSGGTGSAVQCTGLDPCKIKLDQDSSVHAAFLPSTTQKFGIKVAKSGNGSGRIRAAYTAGGNVLVDCGPTCVGSTAAGTVLTLTATPDPGSVIAGFQGQGAAAGCGNSPCQIVLGQDAGWKVDFSFPPATMTLITEGTGAGNVFAKDSSGNTLLAVAIQPPQSKNKTIPGGTVLTFTANPGSNSTFAGWSNQSGNAQGSNCTGTTNPCTFTLFQNSTLKATFTNP